MDGDDFFFLLTSGEIKSSIGAVIVIIHCVNILFTYLFSILSLIHQKVQQREVAMELLLDVTVVLDPQNHFIQKHLHFLYFSIHL